jgi:sugar lactone lactonase YvrE
MGMIHIAKCCTSAAVLLALFGCASSPNAVTLPPSATEAARGSVAPTFHVFTVGKTPGLPITAVPRDIVAGPNGTVWFTDLNTPAIGTISTNLKIREFRTGLGIGAEPYSIIAGPDGNLWFSDGAGAIGRVTPSGKITEFHSQRMVAASPNSLTVGADGAIWSIGVGTSHSYLFRVTVEGKISWFPISPGLIPDGSVEADSKGNLWFFASRLNHAVVLAQYGIDGKPHAAHLTGLITRGEPCCPNIAPNHVVIGPDGNPWYTTPYFALPTTDGQQVGTFASDKAAFFAVNRREIPYLIYPSGIGMSGRYLWFAGSDPLGQNGALWRMNTAGKQTGYAIPYNPAGFAVVNDKTLWFTSQAQGQPPQLVEATF